MDKKVPPKTDTELETEIAGELVMEFGQYGFDTFRYFGGPGFIERLVRSN